MNTTQCIPHIDWFGLSTGAVLFGLGMILTATIVGAVIGIPLLLASLSLFDNPTTLRGTPCAG